MRTALILIIFLVFNKVVQAQDDTISIQPQSILEASSSARFVSVDMSNPDEVMMALRRIHTYRYLEALELQGEAEEKDLRKLFYRISSLRNLNNLILRDNNLKEVPENIATVKLLRSLMVVGSPALQYNNLFLILRTMKLSELHLIDNDFQKIPESISEIKSLRKIQLSGSLQMDYDDFVERLSALPELTTLAIPLNYITELPKNIDRLAKLQVLDVSNNSLSELPSEMSALKTINNLSIYGNLLVDPAKDLEILKGNNIKYLALDREISGEDLEQIKKVFPLAIVDFLRLIFVQ